MNASNAAIANTVAGGQMNMIGNIMGGAGSAMMLADGGPVAAPQVAAPAAINVGSTALEAPKAAPANGPKSSLGQYLNDSSSKTPQDNIATAGQSVGKAIGTGLKSLYNYATGPSDGQSIAEGSAGDLPGAEDVDSSELPQNSFQAPAEGGITGESGISTDVLAPADVSAGADLAGLAMAAHGGKARKKVPALVSPGERYLSPEAVKKVEKGADPIKAGQKIPGKPKVAGAKNSYANDTVPKTLEEGGIVLPRSVTQSKHPHWAAHKFVAAIMAKNKGKMP